MKSCFPFHSSSCQRHNTLCFQKKKKGGGVLPHTHTHKRCHFDVAPLLPQPDLGPLRLRFRLLPPFESREGDPEIKPSPFRLGCQERGEEKRRRRQQGEEGKGRREREKKGGVSSFSAGQNKDSSNSKQKETLMQTTIILILYSLSPKSCTERHAYVMSRGKSDQKDKSSLLFPRHSVFPPHFQQVHRD